MALQGLGNFDKRKSGLKFLQPCFLQTSRQLCSSFMKWIRWAKMSGIDNLFQEETLLSNIKIAAYFRRIDVTDTW